jgi:hypothetical protein
MNDETQFIYSILKHIDCEDSMIDFNKSTPFELYNNNYEYAPFDLVLEKSCINQNNCFYKKVPLECYKNHQSFNTIIKQGHIIPKYLCKYERPWKSLHGYQMRCQNIHCWFSHLQGRKQIISYIANSSHNNKLC